MTRNEATYEFPTAKAADDFADDLLDIYGLPSVMAWGDRRVWVSHEKPRELIDELAATRDGVEVEVPS